MGAQTGVKPRVVFDTGVLVSALVFPAGSLAWLRGEWRERKCVPLVSQATAAELVRALSYPKFRLTQEDQHELLAEYLPYCEMARATGVCPVTSRDRKDQPFLDFAHCGKANFLISGDQDLLTLAGKTQFIIESPAAYHQRIHLKERRQSGR